MSRYLDQFVTITKRCTPAPLRAAVRRAVAENGEPAPEPEPQVVVVGRKGLPHHQVQVQGRVVSLFFIGGCFKSGTNWVQNLLNLHPKVDILGEFHFEVVLNAVDHARNTYWFRGSSPKFEETWLRSGEGVVRNILAQVAVQRPEASWVGDRSPGPLRTMIRGAPHITITRDLRDVLVSWSFHHLRLDNENGIEPRFREAWREATAKFNADPEGFNPLDGLLGDEDYVRARASQWAEISRSIRQNAPKMRADGTPVLELRYEEMHKDLEGARRKLFDLLGLNPDDAEAPAEETRTTPGFAREDRTSFYRSGKVGDWRSYIDDRIASVIKEAAGEELVAEGYEKDLNW